MTHTAIDTPPTTVPDAPLLRVCACVSIAPMSAAALANVVTQALSIAQLGSAVWRTMEEAECALRAFSTAQGWCLATRKCKKHHYKLRDAQGEERPGELELQKVWICSRGHHRQANQPHTCSDGSAAAVAKAAAAESADGPAHAATSGQSCDTINSSGELAAPSSNFPRLPASSKTGCPVSVSVVMLRKAAPENGSSWTEQDSPCSGYKLATPAKLLLPCQHNHSSSLRTTYALTESVAHIPDAVRQEVKELVLANFPSYRIRNYICGKHDMPPLVPAVWTSLIRAIKTELGIYDSGRDLQALIARLTKERNEGGAVFDLTVDGDLTVSAIFFMSRAMVSSFHRCAQFVVMDSTCKTNRFGMSLLIICGVDEHRHIALYATALMKDETQPAFEYVLKQLRRAVGMEAWMRMTCAATDGCAAMTAALAKEAPHTTQQRCVWHLQQNIIKHTGGGGHQLIVRAWYACVYAKSLSEFEAQWTALLREKMSEKCSEYLTKYIHPLRTKWAVYSTGHLTNFGSHSTQLVESLNRLLKMWDVNDRTSLSRAVERICTVKEEETMRRQISTMKDLAVRSVIAGPAGQIQTHDSYKTKVRKILTGAAALLCEEQYDLFSQYQVVEHTPSQALFTLATRVYIVLAANSAAFTDVFQAGQYHPRWWLQYSETMQRELLSKQFWISVGQEVTSDGLRRVRYDVLHGEQEEEKGQAAAASTTSSEGCLLPAPMYPSPSLELHPALLSPQQLYHMIEGECASLRQLACTNPAKLSGLVWTELHQAKVRITQHIDREQRMQQQLNISAAAAVSGGLTSEGIPLASLLAPVSLTQSKPGRPSSKRSRAAVEGVAARKVRAMLPVPRQQERVGELDQEQATAGMSYGIRVPSLVSPAAVASAAATASGAALGAEDASVAAAAAVSSSSAAFTAASADSMLARASGAAAAATSIAVGAEAGVVAAVRVSGRGRVLVLQLTSFFIHWPCATCVGGAAVVCVMLCAWSVVHSPRCRFAKPENSWSRRDARHPGADAFCWRHSAAGGTSSPAAANGSGDSGSLQQLFVWLERTRGGQRVQLHDQPRHHHQL